jgi:hypothetical protein
VFLHKQAKENAKNYAPVYLKADSYVEWLITFMLILKLKFSVAACPLLKKVNSETTLVFIVKGR